jgi:hypothetical protein
MPLAAGMLGPPLGLDAPYASMFDSEPRNAAADRQRGGGTGPDQQFRVVVRECRHAPDQRDNAHGDQEKAWPKVDVDHRLTGVLEMRAGVIHRIDVRIPHHRLLR